MFNLLRKKPTEPSTIVVEGLSCITTDNISIDSVWQQQNTVTPINDVISKTITATPDPVDNAIQKYLEANNTPTPRQHPLHTISFDPHEGVSGNIWHHGSYYLPTIKGMPERIFELCDISDNERETLTTQLHAMTATGNTIIAVATGLLQQPIADLRQIKKTEKLSFIGFVSLSASVSSSAKRLANRDNTTTYLITGQHPTAAHTVASQLNMATKPNEIFDARRFNVMSEAEIKSTIQSAHIYARATPAHKKLITDTLGASGQTVVLVKTAAELDKLLAN